MKRWLYDTTGIESTAVLHGAGAAIGASILVIVFFALVLRFVGLDEDGAQGTMPPVIEVVAGAAVGILLLVSSAYGGFVAAKKAGGQELLHALLAALAVVLAQDLYRLVYAARESSVDFSISLPHLLAAGVGGYVVLRRRRRHESENEPPGAMG